MFWPLVCFADYHALEANSFGALLGGEIFRSGTYLEPPDSLVQGQSGPGLRFLLLYCLE